MEKEVIPRTVDIMRIIMSYAVDPALRSGGITENVHESARKLLRELIKLSDTAIDPSLPKPDLNPPSKKEHSEKSQVPSKSKKSENVEMKRGDWMCSSCNFLNFAPNIRCLECKADGPKRVDTSSAEMKLEDWTCPKCEFMNFARNRKCFRCQEWRPKRQLNHGEWECPKCDYVNFRRNTSCKKCNRERPAHEEASGVDDHAWKSLRTTKDSKFLNNYGDDDSEKEDLDFDDKLDDMLPSYDGKNRPAVGKRGTPYEGRATSKREHNNSFL